MLFEISAKETYIGKVVFPSYFLYALAAAFELHFELQNDVLVDDVFGCMPCYLAHYVGEVFRGDVHHVCIIFYVSIRFVVSFEHHHKMVEQLSYSIRFYVVGAVLRVALKVFVKAYKEGF